MEPDVRRIAVVTRRFSELRGLQSVALGLWVLSLLFRRRFPAIDWLLSWSLLIAIVLIRAYYTSRFGRIERADGNRFWWALWIGISAALVDTIIYARGVPSAFFFTIAAFSAGTVIRDWPFRTHRIVLAAAALAASVTFAGITDDASRAAWLRRTVQVLGVALIIAGAGDHRLLTATLHRNRAADEVAIPERNR